MPLHESTFQYLRPSPEQKATMQILRDAGETFVRTLEAHMPDGPDKTYAIRKAREVAMWANVAVTREADGTPRPGASLE